MSDNRENNVYVKYHRTEPSMSGSVPGSEGGPRSRTLVFNDCKHITCGMNAANNPSYIYFSNPATILPNQEQITQLKNTKPSHKVVTIEIPESTQSATNAVNRTGEFGQPYRIRNLDGAHADSAVGSDTRNGDHLQSQFSLVSYDEGYTAIKLPIEEHVRTLIKNFILPIFGILCLIFTTLVCFGLLSRAFSLLADESICAIINQRKFSNSPLGDFMGGMLVAILLQSLSRVGSLWAAAMKTSISARNVSKGINLIIGGNVGSCAALTLMSIAYVNDKARLRAAFSVAIMHCAFNWFTALVVLPLQIGTDFMYHLSDIVVNKFTLGNISVNKHSYFLPRLMHPIVNAISGIACPPLAEISTKNTINKNATIIANLTNEHNYIKDVDLRFVLTLMNATDSTELLDLMGNGTSNNLSDSINVYPEFGNSFPTTEKSFSKLFSQTSLCQPGSTKNDQYCSGGSAWILTVLTLVLLCIVTFALITLLTKLRGALSETKGHQCRRPRWIFKKSIVIMFGIIGTIITGSAGFFLTIVMHLAGLRFLTDSDQIYQMVVGANLGGAIGNILIAFGQNPNIIHHSLRFSICHFMFNLVGFLIFGMLGRNQQSTGKQTISTARTGKRNVAAAQRGKRKDSDIDHSGYSRSSTTVQECAEYCGPFAGCMRIPDFVRKICDAPRAVGELFGSLAKKHSWFILFYIVTSFFLVPFLLFGVAEAITMFGPMPMLSFISPAILSVLIYIFLIFLNSDNFLELKRRIFRMAKTIMRKQTMA